MVQNNHDGIKVRIGDRVRGEPILYYFCNFTLHHFVMPDFTLNTYSLLIKVLKEQQYTFQTFAGFIKDPAARVIILRHDVDTRNMNSLHTAIIEKEMGITGTYYFRMVPQSYDEEVIKQIAGLGHEIGYHYEDLSRCGVRGAGYGGKIKRLQDYKTARPHDKVLPDEELLEVAISSFRENLAKLRRVVPVETICMHGSPLSKYDNRMLWEKYDYREFGIIGEPYFDINFEEVLYLTDTGRRWDGEAVSIRDKAQGTPVHRSFSEGGGHRAQGEEPRIPPESSEASAKEEAAYRIPLPHFHSTFDIINAAKEKRLPDKIMITVHPQRWDDRSLPWIRELILQNIKNVGKQIITNRQIQNN